MACYIWWWLRVEISPETVNEDFFLNIILVDSLIHSLVEMFRDASMRWAEQNRAAIKYHHEKIYVQEVTVLLLYYVFCSKEGADNQAKAKRHLN